MATKTTNGATLGFIPLSEVLDIFVDIVDPIYTQIVVNFEQPRILADLRDALLPRLISGEIRVGEAAALVDEVL